MEEPNITVICDRPNNGHLTLVFTDNSTISCVQCKPADAFDGLLDVTADLLLEVVRAKHPRLKANGSEDLKDGMKLKENIHEYFEAIRDVHSEFSQKLLSRLIYMSNRQQLVEEGMPESLADLLMADIMAKLEDTKKDEDDEE